jgi:pyridoxine 5-phosphate synthase
MTKLSVNLNKIALIRNSRGSGLPSVTRAATLCIDAGADGITVHPRPDERHIRPHDVHDLQALLKVEFNIEGNPLEPKFLDLVRDVKPTQCTMVPDSREQLTSDHGWDLPQHSDVLRPIIAELKSLGVRVSLFMDAVSQHPGCSEAAGVLAAMVAAKAVGADRVELYTGPYAEAFQHGQRESAWRPYTIAAQAAIDAGLGVNAGHDLNQDNLGPFLENVPGVLEVSIGHALVTDALEIGLAETVRRYAAICRQ